MDILGGLLTDLRRAPKVVADGGRDRWPWSWLSDKTYTGKTVDHDSAMTISAVYRAVSIIANVAGTLPPHVYRRTADRRIPEETEQTSYIWRRPNPEVSKASFWITVFYHLALTGNVFLYVVTVPDRPTRRPVELWPIEPKRVRIGRDAEGNKIYEIDGTIPGRDYTDGGNIVHVADLSYDGLRGISPIQAGRQALGLSLAAEEYAGRWFGQGTAVDAYLSTDQPLTVDQAQRYSEMWEQFKSVANSHKLPVVGHGTKWMSTSLSPEDTQLLLTRQFQVAEVSRLFGVPEHLLGSHDKQSSWGTGIAEQNRGLLTYTVDPKIVLVEQTISDELLPGNYYVKFDRGGLLRGSNRERAEYLGIMRQNGIINANEWREIEDMEPIDGPEGEAYFNPNTSSGKVGSGGTGATATTGA